ncbi:hypothetical protein [Entomobacter blattae]|uniref:Tail fiber protein n=1 Tax=Entomobacter blattae TaxID=2762277 RepID=A0A7H1NR85_9PROT|nr:hypothetical protein [Entomobacter blattae]QNT78295.1 hypothetical protein JGUZn3_10670 [Entomobacter blattae]
MADPKTIKPPRRTTIAFGENADPATIRTLPESQPSDASQASYAMGFPRRTMTPIENGGQPPQGPDMNAILYDLSRHAQWQDAGGVAHYDAAFASAIGGYPVGAILQNPLLPYLLYVNLRNANRVDPTTGTNWKSMTAPGNYWAVVSGQVSDDPDNILFRDHDGRLLAKVSGARNNLYISTSAGNDTTGDGSQEKPYFSIGKALSVIPEGGTVALWLKAAETYYLTADNTARFGGYADIDNRINIGRRLITIEIWGSSFLDQARKDFAAQNSSANPYTIAEGTAEQPSKNAFRVNIQIPSFVTEQGSLLTGSIVGNNGGNIQFNGCNFIPLQAYPAQQPTDGTVFSPTVSYQFVGCRFLNLEYFPYMMGGWGSYSTTVHFGMCQFHSATQGRFFNLDSGQIIVTTDSDISPYTVYDLLPQYQFLGSNTRRYNGSSAAYYGWGLKVIGYLEAGKGQPVYGYKGIDPDYEIQIVSSG